MWSTIASSYAPKLCQMSSSHCTIWREEMQQMGSLDVARRKAMKMIQEHQEARDLLKDVGVTAELNDETLSKMKVFLIRYICNDKTSFISLWYTRKSVGDKWRESPPSAFLLMMNPSSIMLDAATTSPMCVWMRTNTAKHLNLLGTMGGSKLKENISHCVF